MYLNVPCHQVTSRHNPSVSNTLRPTTHAQGGRGLWTRGHWWWESEKQDHFCCLRQKTTEQDLGQPLP